MVKEGELKEKTDKKEEIIEVNEKLEIEEKVTEKTDKDEVAVEDL